MKDILNYEWHSIPTVVSCYVHLLAMADEEGKVNITRRKFCKITGMSEQQYRTALQKLEATHLITQQITQSETFITICGTERKVGRKIRTQPSEQPTKQPSERNVFVKPTIEELSQYIGEKGYDIDPEKFWNFYESKGWMVGRNKMKNWRAAVTTWVRKRNNYQYGNNRASTDTTTQNAILAMRNIAAESAGSGGGGEIW